jgi:hypothetical protein
MIATTVCKQLQKKSNETKKRTGKDAKKKNLNLSVVEKLLGCLEYDCKPGY